MHGAHQEFVLLSQFQRTDLAQAGNMYAMACMFTVTVSGYFLLLAVGGWSPLPVTRACRLPLTAYRSADRFQNRYRLPLAVTINMHVTLYIKGTGGAILMYHLFKTKMDPN